ncbi:PEP-CTERM putative exosortase interaction domain protein [Coleofasciculus chthonoplastes PCC 7420]|uniref:PEP-CTERM putative exosortase interaction domain protein n=2 Tax=Coleofasciculus chthonoplastes TaxID=64178 RepID=B4VLE8_9CYAN|nr:PEP-CTERM putative exosortase interaction domain protein [Coleofasciculus chthonoplastes PCC 7420]
MVGDAEEDSWAGIYVTRTATVPEPSFSLLTGAIVFALGLRCKRKSRP